MVNLRLLREFCVFCRKRSPHTKCSSFTVYICRAPGRTFIRQHTHIFIVLSALGFLLLSGSCRKKETFLDDPSAKLSFSTDSVLFDTVFTTIGSATRNFRLINNNNQRIRISSLALEGGASSPFFLNVDGEKGKVFRDLEIAAHDSMYVFVQVMIDPTGANAEVIINDKVICTTNGNTQ